MGSVTVLDQIRRDILSCDLAPGIAIYEQQLAQRFGVSKSPVREALVRLQEQKLVEVRARSGYRVRPISLAEAEEMYEMRQLLERACVALAIDRAEAEQIDSLREHLTTEGNMGVADWLVLNRRFHSAITALSGNSCLADTSNRLNEQFDRFTIMGVARLQQPVDFTSFNKEHAALVSAMKRRDKRTALSIVRAHISASRERSLTALSSPGIVP